MAVSLAILGFLHQRNYHGYELKKLIERKMGMWTDIKFGSIYNSLTQLERRGLIEKVRTSRSPGKPTRSEYGITGRGRVEFAGLLEDNLLNCRRVFLADDMGVYFGSRVSRAKFAVIIRKRIEDLAAIAGLLKAHISEMDDYDISQQKLAKLMVARHVAHIAADIEWFENLHQELQAGRLFLTDSKAAKRGGRPSAGTGA